MPIFIPYHRELSIDNFPTIYASRLAAGRYAYRVAPSPDEADYGSRGEYMEFVNRDIIMLSNITRFS